MHIHYSATPYLILLSLSLLYHSAVFGAAETGQQQCDVATGSCPNAAESNTGNANTTGILDSMPVQVKTVVTMGLVTPLLTTLLVSIPLAFIGFISQRIWRFLDRMQYTHATLYETSDAYDWLTEWLVVNDTVSATERNVEVVIGSGRKKSGFWDRYMSNTIQAESTKDEDVNFVPQVGQTQRVQLDGVTYWISRMRETHGSGKSERKISSYTISVRNPSVRLTGGHGKEHIKKLLEASRAQFKVQQQGKTQIRYSHARWGTPTWQKYGARPKRPLDSVHLPPDMMKDLISDVEWFLTAREWYSKRGIPYRRGYLLYGSPGCGKSSFIFALAGRFDLPVCIIDLSVVDGDHALNQLLNMAPSPSLLLFEEIDTAFSSKKATKKPDGAAGENGGPKATCNESSEESDTEGEDDDELEAELDELLTESEETKEETESNNPATDVHPPLKFQTALENIVSHLVSFDSSEAQAADWMGMSAAQRINHLVSLSDLFRQCLEAPDASEADNQEHIKVLTTVLERHGWDSKSKMFKIPSMWQLERVKDSFPNVTVMLQMSGQDESWTSEESNDAETKTTVSTAATPSALKKIMAVLDTIKASRVGIGKDTSVKTESGMDAEEMQKAKREEKRKELRAERRRKKKEEKKTVKSYREQKQKVSFNGVLNALDGIAAQEGRIVFFTTNHRKRLDPALTRPGRMDREFRFNNASVVQVRDMFRRFFEGNQYYQDNPGADVDRDADKFGTVFREAKRFSMAAVQGYLTTFVRKPNAPLAAVEGARAYFVQTGESTKLRSVILTRQVSR